METLLHLWDNPAYVDFFGRQRGADPKSRAFVKHCRDWETPLVVIFLGTSKALRLFDPCWEGARITLRTRQCFKNNPYIGCEDSRLSAASALYGAPLCFAISVC